MKGNVYRLFIVSIFIISGSVGAAERWQIPFDTSAVGTRPEADSVYSLAEVMRLVALQNLTLQALEYRREAARGMLKQVGLWSNPELGLEAEEIGWDAPGFNESELSISLSQEFELFGQRKARKNLARSQIDNVHLQARLAAFDLYLETKARFYALFHAQQQLELASRSVELAGEIVDNTKFRIENGAALQSELLLADLEYQRAQVALEQAQQEVSSTSAVLTALWGDSSVSVAVSANIEPDFQNALNSVASLEFVSDSVRSLLQLHQETAILRAEASLAAAEARPPISLSGGFKHLEGTNSNSLLFGVSLPIPLFNRNQGTRKLLASEIRALELTTKQTRVETRADLRSQVLRLRQLVQRHDRLDSLLLPTAENAYSMLQDAYKAGRVPYTQLLEAERSLNELRFEHNDMLLQIHDQVIAIERVTGIPIRIDKE
ncbi:MAG: TolC family protein [Candidatus Abyssobacteria bacterium SURF_17]|uniref:TolC family protein n=1 Tax=Candidatus Abyssobacteria bacterium SURF_17 TaxID=2093361 RepID=A0A419EZ68_9BACT|nr:MAG: TolC family protein [Candidatus Abyssubacteria bacterium SURF_17]